MPRKKLPAKSQSDTNQPLSNSRLDSTSTLDSEYNLSLRQRNLLFTMIKEYCETGESLGSNELRKKYNFNFSPATIRNEFSRLRDLGYLYQPFTNSSNIPTERAYRLFVIQLVEGLRITTHRQRELEEQIKEMQAKQASLSKEISRLLSIQAGVVGFSANRESESITGINNLLNSPSEGSINDVLDFLDNLDQHKTALLEHEKPENTSKPSTLADIKVRGKKSKIQTYFGGDIIPIGRGFALAASKVKFEGEETVVGIIAPSHILARKQNLELVEGLRRVFEEDK